ncbi:MAG: transcription termination/antitermination protein NusA [Leptospiraceae bacterium]|nr:transcription termination/antitermination protein NusA [Leptospiraceae bacterium]
MAKAKKKQQTGPDIRAFFDSMDALAAEKGLGKDEIMEIFRGSLITSYQRKHGPDARIEVQLDAETPSIGVQVHKQIVDSVEDPSLEITVEEAKKYREDAAAGEELIIEEEPFAFSRIGATNVRHIFFQRLKEQEREIIYNEFKHKEGDLINGQFLRWRDREVVYVDLGRAEGVLPRREQIPRERFHPGDRIKAVIKSVELRREKSRDPGPYILLSRAAPDFVRRLFEQEIPEIYDGVVEIMDIVRDAGFRSKLLVRSNRSDVDPVGACVGIKGVRIQSIVRELGNERIDIVNYSPEAAELIANAISPARVAEVRADSGTKEALVLVPDDQLRLAQGPDNKNVKLAARLTGFRLIVKSLTQFGEEMSSPEARAQLEQLFSPKEEEGSEGESDYTPLNELPGLSSRIIDLLEQSGVKSVEDLVELEPEELEALQGIGKTTAAQILKILEDVVSFEEV